ncbi:MAG: four-carbon acid sugar kinase family protein, partial [Variovorax sp.]
VEGGAHFVVQHARAMSPDEMRAELVPVAGLFTRLGARVLHYKVCSTFDSAPATGSIGVALETLHAGVPGLRTAVVGGQPDLGRYCLFGNLFARAGSAGEVFRIDRHPTMSRHPVTPMHEADLRVHLAAQGLADLRLVPWTAWQSAEADVAVDGALFDVSCNADLMRIGAQLWHESAAAPLAVAGASSVVQALAPQIAQAAPAPQRLAAARGPVLALAGSLSPVTAEQVAQARSFETLWIDPRRLCESDVFIDECAGRMAASLRSGRHVLACTVQPVPPGQAPTQDAKVNARALALAGGQLLRRALAQAPGVTRAGVAGGDTSSHAVQALDAWGLSYVCAVSAGVSLCRVHSDQPSLDGLEIALKGGQMGAPDLFERLVAGEVG